MRKHWILGAALLTTCLAPACSSGSHATGATSSGAGGGGGSGGAGGACSDTPATTKFKPGPADVEFEALSPLPKGEQIVFNDWHPIPNTLSSMTPDGVTVTHVLQVYRIFAFGVSHDAGSIAFACGDPLQEKHYDLALGDAIQHTWLYDVATRKASLLTDGNVDDECQAFAPDDKALYVCRRYDVSSCGTSHGFRIAHIALPGGAATFLTPDDTNLQTRDPQPSSDGAKLYFDQVDVTSRETEIQAMALPKGKPAKLLANATSPVLSPDGTRYAYVDTIDAQKLHVVSLDGTGDVPVTDVAASSAVWSPDGTKIAYLYLDAGAMCSHVEVVSADGSDAQSPTRIRDCGTTNEFITQIAWFTRS